MRRIFRVIKWAVGLLIVAILAWVGVAYVTMQTTFPKIDGEVTVAGTSGPITIVRDANGIPHITAQSLEDSYFAVGYVQAQDRFWQMHMNRTIAAGRLSEILGGLGLGTDKFLRTLGVYKKAQSAYQKMDAPTKASLKAFSRGVNAWLDSRSGFVTPEFGVLLLGKPEPWKPADSVAWMKMMSWDLGANWSKELTRLKLASRLPMQRVNEFYPPYPGDKPIVIPDLKKLYGFDLVKTAKWFNKSEMPAVFANQGVLGVGSNNWVLSGNRTKTGKPMLSNDPHLGLTAPSVWYYIHVSVPSAGLDAIGASLPGVPYVILGRNQKIAWGFTNTAPDVQDLFVERYTKGDKTSYDTPDGPKKFVIRKETIKVRLGSDVTIDVRETRHGPVISDVLRGVPELLGDKAVLSFQWTALRNEDTTAQAARLISFAGNWEEFLKAARHFHAPQQNMVYADLDGNIGYIAAALVPIRKPGNKIMGKAPSPGWDATYDWAGFIPFDQLPQKYNPASGVIYTANEKVIDPNYPHYITSEWTLPYRADRIKALLAATEKHDAASFARVQGDVKSLFVADLLPLMLPHIAKDQSLAKAYALLKDWDGTTGKDTAHMLVFAFWYDELVKAIVDDESDFLYRDKDGKIEKNRRHWIRSELIKKVLKNEAGHGAWCGNAGKSDGAVDCGPLVKAALEKALDKIAARHGTDMAKWKWGDEHVAVSNHRPMGEFPLLNKLFNVTIPTGGGPHTVNVSNYKKPRMGFEFPNVHAASLRHIFDLSDLDNSTFIFSAGQSGHPLSPFYKNLSADWAALKARSLSTKPSDYKKDATGTLTLRNSGS